MKLTPPQIARLFARSRQWAWVRTLAGDFGPHEQDGRIWKVELAGVEKYARTTFTEEQIAAAINKRPAHVPNIEVLADVE